MVCSSLLSCKSEYTALSQTGADHVRVQAAVDVWLQLLATASDGGADECSAGTSVPTVTALCLQLLNAADVNKDGVVDIGEFVPVALGLLQAAEESLSAGDYSDAALEDYIARLFAIGDVNGDGVLDPAELDK